MIKAWRSGATRALLSGWNEPGEPCLVGIAIEQPDVRVTSSYWQAVGMAACDSVDVQFDHPRAAQFGAPRD
jgi:hypothetical protein